jgi:hypothetical protein
MSAPSPRSPAREDVHQSEAYGEAAAFSWIARSSRAVTTHTSRYTRQQLIAEKQN